METNVSHTLQTALFKILKALARLVLRFGLSYQQFEELAKQAFVEVAEEEAFTLQGRKQTDSRIAVVTGLSRKEVKRLRAAEKYSENMATPAQYNRAARVLNGWLRDRTYQDDHENPRVLPIEGDGLSFTRLVRAYGGDIPVRAVLDELVRVGAVIRLEHGYVRAMHPAYVVTDNAIDKLTILGTDVTLLLDTITHNLDCSSDKTYLQLKVSYDNLPAEALPLLRKITSEDGQTFLRQLNRWFMLRDRDANPEAQTGQGRYYAGVGIYFFTRELDTKK